MKQPNKILNGTVAKIGLVLALAIALIISAAGAQSVTGSLTLKHTTTTVSCSPNPFTVGTPFGISIGTTCTANVWNTIVSPTISAVHPQGTVAFTISDTPNGQFLTTPCILVANGVTGSGKGKCSVTLTDILVGTPTVTATYSGDVNNATSFNTTIVTVQKASPNLKVACVPSPFIQSAFGSSTCTATVTGGFNPTGTVGFGTSSGTGAFVPNTPASCTLVSGSCGITYYDTVPGAPTITATYSGDVNNNGFANTTIVDVAPATCSLGLVPTPTPFNLSGDKTGTISATNNGNVSTSVFVSGTDWWTSNNSTDAFSVGSTLWGLGGVPSTALTQSQISTGAPIAPTASQAISFNAVAPAGTPPGSYTQVITITGSC